MGEAGVGDYSYCVGAIRMSSSIIERQEDEAVSSIIVSSLRHCRVISTSVSGSCWKYQPCSSYAAGGSGSIADRHACRCMIVKEVFKM